MATNGRPTGDQKSSVSLKRAPSEAPLRGIGTVVKLIFSIILAYPLSGAIYAIVGLIKLAFTSPASLKDLPVDFLMVLLWVIMVPSCGGFVPQNEADAGPRINMYPWIIPTAAAIFFILSGGWRWFRTKR
jgi:hypothetical protein